MKSESSFKIAVVTGAAHRVGAVISKTVVDLGYSLILHYFSAVDEAMDLTKELTNMGGSIFPFQADLTKESDIRKLWNFVDEIKGETMLLVNSSSIMPKKEIGLLTSKEFDQLMALNLRAPLLCSQEAAKRMKSGSLIINISDIASILNWTGYPLYSISRTALDSLTRIMAKEFAPEIRVNGIAPGLITPPDEMKLSEWKKLMQKVPLGRNANEKELKMTIRFLVENGYITGQTLLLDGGRTL
jgi:pteridine reductase